MEHRNINGDSIDRLREKVAMATLQDEEALARELIDFLGMSEQDWASISAEASAAVNEIRSAEKTPLIDQFLNEYGLSSKEGVQLMRLAEALSRTSDATTANELINDKLEGYDWLSHSGPDRSVALRTVSYLLHIASKWLHWASGQKAAPASYIATAGNSVLRMGTRFFIKALSSQFVFAETLDSAMKRAAKYQREGYLFSFDMLGEAARTQNDAQNYYAAYKHALETVSRHAQSNSPAKNHGISIKLSALHPRYEYAQAENAVPEIVSLLKPLAIKACEANVQITIDAEEAERLDISMAVLSELIKMPELQGWTGLGFVVQAYQRRALPLLNWLEQLAIECESPLTIRLVKGAYWDSEIKRAQELGLDSYPVFTRKETTDLSYLACAKKLLSNTKCFHPQFATHNAHSVVAIRAIAGSDCHIEYQRLFGMGQQLHDMILRAPNQVSRVYAPVGTQKDLLSYLIRRLLENGANSSFVHKLADNDIPAADLVEGPVAIVDGLDTVVNDKIPTPRGYLGSEREAAIGRDFSNPIDRRQFLSELHEACEAKYEAFPIVDEKIDLAANTSIKNPANFSEIVGQVAHANREIADQAMVVSQDSFECWSRVSNQRRGEILNKAADLLEQRAPTFHYLAIKEAGKTWSDAVDEVREAVDFCRYYAARANDPNFAYRKPLGVVVCISPWNFPLAIFLGQITAALAAGNCVVAKPAEQTPLIAAQAVHLLIEAGVPLGVINLVPGDGAVLGDALIAHPYAAGICFTGSTATAKRIAYRLAETGRPLTPLIAETGGINAMLVDSSALPEQTVDAVISSAFQSAGQRCSALRLLCLQEDIAEDFISLLKGAMEALNIGDPAQLANDVGPVIDADAKQNIENHIAKLGKKAKRVSKIPASLPDTGHYVAPVAFELEQITNLDQEIFGPVLHIVRFPADQKSKVIDRINASGYGLTLGLQSRIDNLTRQFSGQANVGNIYINRNQIGAVVGTQPFGGHGLSGTGPKAGGPLYLYRLSQTQSCSTPKKQAESPDIHIREKLNGAGNEYIIKGAMAARTLDIALNQKNIVSLIGSGLEPKLSIELNIALENLSRIAATEVDLPSTAGETNRYSLHGRGLIISLLLDEDDLMQTAVRALASRNALLHIYADKPSADIQKLSKDLLRHNGIAGLINQVSSNDLNSIIDEDSLDTIGAFVVQKYDPRIVEIAKQIARSHGPIIPILTPDDNIDRYVHEKVVSDNIAATGGDISLLNS